MATNTTIPPRERILQEAEHLLHLRGYLGTSLEDIAAAARMTKANIFHHFRSKEALGLAVLDYKIDCYRRNCLEPIFAGNPDPVQAVSRLFAQAGSFHRNNGCKAGCFVGNIAQEMSDLNDRFRQAAGRFFEEWTGLIEALLRRRREEGYFFPGFDPRSCAEAVLALYEGATLLARTRRDPGVFERMGRQAAGLVQAGRLSVKGRPAGRFAPTST